MEHIKKIHNAIYVSDRIITYKAAAAILEINVNEVKDILEKYVNDLSNKGDTINISYVIGGVTLTDQNKVRIVSQNKYNQAKSSFKTITINHIYSIQKSPLIDWTPVFNVDDYLYDKNDSPREVTVKQEKVEIPEIKKEVKAPLPSSKKGGISTLFNNVNNQKKSITNQKSPKEAVRKEAENSNNGNKTKKQEKNTAFTNYFKASNKENLAKVNSTVKKEQVNSDDDEEIFKVNKKRSRVLNDDDDEENDINPTKCPKVDILDDPMEEDEQKEEYHSDEDIFGSPEKDEELMKDSEESVEKNSPIFPENTTQTSENNTETTEKNTETSENTETTENNTETTENNTETTENSETMYEDDDGYFVTEKKKPGAKSAKVKQEYKNKTKEKKKVEKEEKKHKKEVVQKIKNNTNQKSILSFFQKK